MLPISADERYIMKNMHVGTCVFYFKSMHVWNVGLQLAVIKVMEPKRFALRTHLNECNNINSFLSIMLWCVGEFKVTSIHNTGSTFFYRQGCTFYLCFCQWQALIILYHHGKDPHREITCFLTFPLIMVCSFYCLCPTKNHSTRGWVNLLQEENSGNLRESWREESLMCWTGFKMTGVSHRFLFIWPLIHLQRRGWCCPEQRVSCIIQNQ